MRAPPYFLKVVACTAGCPEVRNCNVDESLSPRWLPRGSTSRCAPGQATLMVILENPGEAQSIEDRHFGGKRGRALADAAWNQSEAALERKTASRWGAGRGPSHDPLMKHLADDVFGCALGEVLDRTVITNVVRCSTPRPFGEYRPEVRLAIGTECVRRHLIPEIAYWQPRFIVACGNPVKELLLELRRQGVVDLEFFETHHPSALGQSIAERKSQFAAIGEEIRRATAS